MATRALTIARRAVATVAPMTRGFRVASVLAAKAEVVPTKKGKKEASLFAVLEKELEYENEDNNTANTLKELTDALEGWTINDEAGTSRFSATRKWGAQTLTVDVDCNPLPTDEEYPNEDEEGNAEEEPEGMDGYRMLVTVKSDGKPGAMQFGCMLTDHLRIHKVATYPTGNAPTPGQVFSGSEESPAYGGPNFDELDQAVQNAFYDYLADRGVDDSLAEKLGDYAASKEQAEYVAWLNVTKELVK